MQLQAAVNHFDDEREVLHHRRAIGFPLEDGVVVHSAREFEAPADIICVADRWIEAGRAVGFRTPVIVILVELPY